MPAGQTGGPMTYMVNGKPYIVVRSAALDSPLIGGVQTAGLTAEFYAAERVFRRALHVQIFHIQRILFNKLPPAFHILAHQRSEIKSGRDNVLQPHHQQCPLLRDSSSYPQVVPRSSRRDPCNAGPTHRACPRSSRAPADPASYSDIAVLIPHTSKRRLVEFRNLLREHPVFPVLRLLRKLDSDPPFRISLNRGTSHRRPSVSSSARTCAGIPALRSSSASVSRFARSPKSAFGIDLQFGTAQYFHPRAESLTRRSSFCDICWNSSRLIRNARNSPPSRRGLAAFPLAPFTAPYSQHQAWLRARR